LVKKGDVILEIDPVHAQRQAAAVENENKVAHANLTRAGADAKIAEDSEALNLRMQTDSTRETEEGVKWFDTVDGPQMLEIADLMLKNSKSSMEDQEDELNELKKMYKGDDLTTDTADIVVKRAVRSYELAKASYEMQVDRSRKTKTYLYPAQKQRVHDSAKQAEQQLESLKIAQAQTKVLRETGLKGTRAAAEAADQKLADIRADLEKLIVRASDDGVVCYGQFAGGAFQGADPHALKVGERIAPQQVVMTCYTPGKLRVHFDLPETKFFLVHEGAKATLTPAAMPELKTDGIFDACAAVPINGPQGIAYPVTISMPSVDPKLVPGMRVNVHADAAEVENALLVPNSALADGSVWIKTPEGKKERRTVTVGKTDGKRTEIKQGLSEGDEVFVEAQK
jgi:multidrug efflux pump subunit AcrA (membrane-fusion protein)